MSYRPDQNTLYPHLFNSALAGVKSLAVLIDPDKTNGKALSRLLNLCNKLKVDYLFVGGSLLVKDVLGECIASIREYTSIPIVLFPGNNLQIDPKADALLLLSLISGRNADTLIGQHVVAAPQLRESKLEIIPTGYMLIDGGVPTTVSYMSNSNPIPHDKPDIAFCTALAGQMLGMKLIYMDAGSGAESPVSPEMISAVRSNLEVPLIVGGGIKSPEIAESVCTSGADLIVVGNALEKDPLLLMEISLAIRSKARVH